MQCPECQSEVVAVEATIDPRSMGYVFTAQCGDAITPEDTRRLWADGMRWSLPVIDGTSLFAAERRRHHTEEGHTPASDAEAGDNLAWMAWCYLDRAASGAEDESVPKMWPGDEADWKPEHSPLRMLVIAGSLIAAEIDRRLKIDRTRG